MPSQFGGIAVDDIQPAADGSQFGGIPVDNNAPKPDTSFISNYGQSFTNAANEGRIGLEGLGQSVGKALYGANPQDTSEQAGRQAELNKIKSETAQSGVEPSGMGGTLGSIAGSIAGNPTSWTPLGEINGIGDLVKGGAKLGAASGLIENTDDNSIWNHLLNAGIGGAEGAAGSAILGKAGQAIGEIPSGIINRAKGAFADTAEDIASQSDKNWEDAGNLFKSSTANGAVLHDASAQNVLDRVKSDVGVLGSRTIGTAGVLDDFQKAIDNGGMTPDKLHDLRQDLGDVISKDTKSKIDGGGVGKDGQKAMAAKNALDESLSGLTEKDLAAGTPQAINDLQNGISSTAKAYRYDRLGDMLKDAQGDPNAIKKGAEKLLKSMKGLSDDETAALQDMATRGTGQAIERGLGTFGIDWGKTKNMALPTLVGDAAKGGLALHGGAPLVGVGTVLRQTGKLAAKGKGQNALDTFMERETEPDNAPSMAKKIFDLQQRVKGTPAKAQGEVSDYFVPNKNSGAAHLAIPAAAGGAALAAQQIMNKGNIGQQNQDELKKLQFPQQPQQKPQSSLPDVSSFAKAESGENPNARNPNSTASGLYQFTNRTWGDMVMRYGKQTGIGFGDKGDPKAQATMAALYAQDNIKSLQKAIGRMPTKGELYEAHVLGAHGAAKLINANPNQEALLLFPRQVFDANRPIFFDGRRPRSVAEVRNLLAQKVA